MNSLVFCKQNIICLCNMKDSGFSILFGKIRLQNKIKKKVQDKSVTFNSIIDNILLQKIIYLNLLRDNILEVTFFHSI